MNQIQVYRLYIIRINRELENGAMRTVREIKQSVVNINSTFIPNVNDTLGWTDITGEMCYGIVKDKEIILNTPRLVLVRIDDPVIIDIPMEPYVKLINHLPKDHELKTKPAYEYTLKDWFMIRDSCCDYNKEMKLSKTSDEFKEKDDKLSD